MNETVYDNRAHIVWRELEERKSVSIERLQVSK